jgi:hypothetical protein
VTPADLEAVLDGCPGGAHVAWMLAAWSAGAPPIEPREVARHATPWFGDPEVEPWPPWMMNIRETPQAVVEVLGWRTSAFGEQVTTYRAADGRLYDLVSRVDDPGGIVVDFRTMRSANGADIGARPIADLTDHEWAAIRDCFASAFRGADGGHLDRRFAVLSTIGLDWRDGRLLGFSAVGMREADLPFVGHRSFLDCGLTCVDPGAQEAGISNAVGTIAMQHTPFDLPNEFALLNFATPVMLRAAFRFGTAAWPGTDIEQVAAAMANPTRAQRAVGQAIADLFGAKSYDAEHWVMRAVQPFGESGTDPHDLEPGYGELFRHVDRAAGDTLLGMFWWNDPPPAWWT